LQGFDPVAAGKLTAFDFDVSEYCEDPDLCIKLKQDATNLQALSGGRRLSTVAVNGVHSNFPGWFLFVGVVSKFFNSD
jgi:hypothetical protein